MKKALSIILILLLTINLFGCQSQEDKNEELVNAILKGETNRIGELIESGANVNCKNVYTENYVNFSPLKIALYQDGYDTTITELLIKHGADVNEVNEENGENLLFDLVRLGKVKRIIALIDNGIDIDRKNNEGITPLMLAAEEDKYSVEDALISHGANTDIENNKGETVADIQERRFKEHTELRNYKKALASYPQIGMTAKEVKNTIWGEPKEINKTTTKYGVREQWVYNGYRYIYLENGIVTAIQE